MLIAVHATATSAAHAMPLAVGSAGPERAVHRARYHGTPSEVASGVTPSGCRSFDLRGGSMTARGDNSRGRACSSVADPPANQRTRRHRWATVARSTPGRLIIARWLVDDHAGVCSNTVTPRAR
jgi:hypothetical protein